MFYLVEWKTASDDEPIREKFEEESLFEYEGETPIEQIKEMYAIYNSFENEKNHRIILSIQSVEMKILMGTPQTKIYFEQ